MAHSTVDRRQAVNKPYGLPLEVRFLRLLAQRLHQYGTAAHRLETAVSAAAARLNMQCQVFANPTSLLMSFRYPDDEEDQDPIPTQMLRMQPGGIDTAKLRFVDQVAEGVVNGRITLPRGYYMLKRVPLLHTDAPVWLQLICWANVSGAVATLLGASAISIALGALLGGILGGLNMILGSRLHSTGSWEAIAAFVMALGAHAGGLVPQGEAPLVILASIIIVIPGLGLTVAITELSTNHLASGTARMSGAIVELIKLAFGVVAGNMLALSIPQLAPLPTIPVPEWITWPGMLLAALSFPVLFKAPRSDAFYCAIIAMSSYSVTQLASELPASMDVFCAAFVVAGMSNLYARWLNRPAMITRLPGIILLVPGSVGYSSLTMMFEENFLGGLESAITVVLILASLVAGLLLGNTLVPPRRHL